jgi:thiol:disulfide interchange protein DsbD
MVSSLNGKSFRSMRIPSTHSYCSTALIAVLLLCALPGRLYGQIVNGEQVVRAELVTAADDFTKPFLVGVKFAMQQGWYLYWKNPGDAGLPVEVTWSLPEGYTAGELQFPTPSKFVYDDLIAYGYKNELVLFAEIRPPGTPAASVPALRANLDWLVCKESCVRGRAEVVLAPATLQGTTLATNGRLLKKWRNLLPGPLSSVSLQISKPTVEGGGGKRKVSFTVRGDGAEDVTDFYPLGLNNAAIDHKSITVKQNTVSFEIVPYTEGETIPTIKGLLIARGKAYECMVVLPVM